MIAANLVVAWIREFTLFHICINATSNLHNKMAYSIMRAKVIFFDSNPIGRILTRFSKEMALMDMVFPVLMTLTSYGMFRVVSATISLAIVNVWLFIPVFFLCIYFVLVAKSASIAMIEASRLDSVVRGPIHNLFAMTINGLTSMRAYR